MVKDSDLYQGIPKDTMKRWKQEVKQQYDPKLVKQSQQRLHKMTKEEWEKVKAEGSEITVGISKLMDKPVSDIEVQKLVAAYHTYMHHFYDCTLDIFRGLGDLYVQNPEFTAFYEKISPGLACYMRDAMHYYCDHQH